MGLGPKRKEVTSQATPLARSVLGTLQTRGIENVEMGLGPLSREAGTAARQFARTGGGEYDFSKLVSSLEERQRRLTGEQVADLREGFGAAGTRFGTSLSRGEADLRSNLTTDFESMIQNMMYQEFQNRLGRQLAGAQLSGQLAQANLAPLFQLAAMGINPDVFTPGTLSEIGNFVGNVGQGVGKVVAAV